MNPIEKEIFFIAADESHIRIEKSKARVLRKSQWWKNQLATNNCYYCKKRIPAKELTMDHMTPIIRGGKTTKKNVVACCKECNNDKKYYVLSEWDKYLKNEF